MNLSFTYTTNQAGGVRIFARPFTRGALTPNYAAHGSPIHPTGSGLVNGFFTITSGSITVDHIRVQMWDAGETTLLFEAFLPVHYRFTNASGNVLSRIGLTAATPNATQLGERVWVSFDYATTRMAGVRVVVQPLTNGRATRNSSAPRPLYPTGSGNGRTWFTVKKVPATVTQLRLTMWNVSRTRVLFKTTIPVHYQFRNGTNIVHSVTLSPATPNILKFGENVNLAMTYTTNEAGGVYIWARPMSGGALAPNYAAHGSPIYPAGFGNATGYFTITNGTVLVNEIRVQMWNTSQTKLLFSAKMPVSYTFR